MRGNHVLVAGSVGRHYQWWPIVSTWIGWRQMLFAGYLMLITMLSKNLSSFHYFLDISNGVHLLFDTNQRGYYDSLVMFNPFLHSILLHLYPQRRLTIDDFSFLNTLHRLESFVVFLVSVQHATLSGFIGCLTHSWVCHNLGSLLDIHPWCMIIYILYQIHLCCPFKQQLCHNCLHLQLLMQTCLDMQWYNIFTIQLIYFFLTCFQYLLLTLLSMSYVDYQKIVESLEYMIHLRMVTTVTDAYTLTKHCLRLATSVTEQGNVNVHSRRRRDTQDKDGGGRGSWFSIIWLTMYMSMVNICIYFVFDYYVRWKTNTVFITQIWLESVTCIIHVVTII